MIHGRLLAFKDCRHKGHRFANGNGGQVHTIGHIPNRINRRHGGLAELIHHNLTTTAQFDAEGV